MTYPGFSSFGSGQQIIKVGSIKEISFLPPFTPPKPSTQVSVWNQLLAAPS
jgi:hypothetical protein